MGKNQTSTAAHAPSSASNTGMAQRKGLSNRAGMSAKHHTHEAFKGKKPDIVKKAPEHAEAGTMKTHTDNRMKKRKHNLSDGTQTTSIDTQPLSQAAHQAPGSNRGDKRGGKASNDTDGASHHNIAKKQTKTHKSLDSTQVAPDSHDEAPNSVSKLTKGKKTSDSDSHDTVEGHKKKKKEPLTQESCNRIFSSFKKGAALDDALTQKYNQCMALYPPMNKAKAKTDSV